MYSLVHMVEQAISFLVWVLPAYQLTKCIFLIWCLAPLRQNGATITYRLIVRPVVKEYFEL